MLKVTNLSYAIDESRILDNLDLQVLTGQYVALAGENGAGKSTLIKIVLDLIRNIQSGRIELNGEDNRQVIARRFLSYLPERFDVRKEVSGKNYLSFIFSINQLAWNRPRVEQLCNHLDFEYAWLSRKTAEYSKGMMQKLGLISCFMLDKPLLILDEPLSGLDPKARYQFKRLLQAEREAGRTIFYSTHMLADAEEICDRLSILHRGRIVFDGTPVDCLEQFEAATLEQAYMRCISADEAHDEPQASSG